MSILKKYLISSTTFCMLFCSLVWAQKERGIAYVDTLGIKEIEMGSTLDYIRFSKQSKIEVADFVRNNPSLFYITDNQKMFIKKTEEDELGFVHYRYGQTYMGIPIEDADYWIHYKDSMLTTANGKLANLSEIVFRAARLTKGEAISYFQNHEKKKTVKGIKKADDSGEYETKLLWASKDKDTTGTIQEDYYLAYRVTNKSNSLVAYLDAETGEVKYDFYESYGCQAPVSFNSYYYGTKNVTTNLQGGLYRMQDICPSVCANLNKNIQVTDENDNVITNTSNTWTTDLQRKAATSQWAASNTYNYFCEKHNWKGYDNNNSLLTLKLTLSSITPRWSMGTIEDVGNANSNPSTPYCTQDIMAHEYTHGFVIANIGSTVACKRGAGPLPYIPCQATSLNEAIADMLGIAVEYDAMPTTANFLIAEDAISTGLRNVSNPKSKGFPNCIKSLDNPSPTNWSSEPNEAMTYNNGAVATFWFHLLCNGGSGNVDDKPTNPAYNVTAIGMDKAAKIVVRALRYYGFSGIGFEQFRRATIEACKDLYGNCSNEVLQTAKAWNAVGLGEFINYYDQNSTAPPLCGDFGGMSNKHEIYYVQNAMTIPSVTCNYPQSFIVKSGSMLVVTSAQGIVLKPGFRAEAGSRFKATATSCLTQTLRRGNSFGESFITTDNQSTFLNTWSLAPNPYQGQDIYLNYPNDKTIIKISLSDIQGRIIQADLPFEISVQGARVSNKGVPKGMYLIYVTTMDGEHKTLKLIHN